MDKEIRSTNIEIRNNIKIQMFKIKNSFELTILKIIICFGFRILNFGFPRPEGEGGRGAFYLQRSCAVRHGGVDRSENAGMSSEMPIRIRHAENPRFPPQCKSAEG